MSQPVRRHRVPRLVALVGTVTLTLAVAAPSAGAAKKTKIKVNAGKVDLVKVGNGPDSFPPDAQAGVLAAIRTYLNSGSVVALKTGTADDAALATAFDPAAMTDVTGADRPTVTDEGLPKARGALKITVTPVAMTGLFDGDNKLAVVAAQLNQKAKWTSAKGKAKLTRRGELVLTGQDDGSWKISEYTLTVKRSGPGLGKATTSTTGAPTTGTTGKAAS